VEGAAVNINLFLAATWAVFFVAILLVWENDENRQFAVTDHRLWLAGVALVMASYRLVRWRLARGSRPLEDEPRPPRRRHPDEPPNPDFDFSDPKPGSP
jgi:hypothetical protein